MLISWEVWGVEAGSPPPPILLAKFREEADGEQAAKDFARDAEEDGTTQIRIVKVEA